ncbi:MAG: Histidine--tRNA ligase [Bacteroidota bacterium]|jgi:histidyl-tRNA synthetase
MSSPSIPKGTRDFSPQEMAKRQFIFSTLRQAFENFGFQALETPSMENLSTLTGKYGDEGDQLIFRILNSGDFLKGVEDTDLQQRDLKKMAGNICEKALRYDLTVPFARYVVMNRNQLVFPFRRYQIQPVWRADRPQKGRYREFYQCDADIIGTDSLICEIELIQLFNTALARLGLPSFTIKINNRKILAGIAEVTGLAERMGVITVAIDKLDKIGWDGVQKELKDRNIAESGIASLRKFFDFSGDNEAKLRFLEKELSGSETGSQGVRELKTVMDLSSGAGASDHLEIDITLARGLNYYTGAIFEVKANGVSMGSICGGGRYDDLTGIFGLPGVSGIGISFGADRIYDVLEELNLFPDNILQSTRILITNFGDEEMKAGLNLVTQLRSQGIASELYPENSKMKKQMKYADDKRIPFVALLGSDEMSRKEVSVRNMQNGEQVAIRWEDLADFLRNQH